MAASSARKVVTGPGARLLVTAGLAALALAPAVDAKVYFSGVPASVARGARVEAYVAGCEAAPGCGRAVRGVRVFLARATTGSTSFATPPRPRWLLGAVTATGRLAFQVPGVRSGRYRLVARLTFGSRPQYLPASAVFAIEPAANSTTPAHSAFTTSR